jgi:outer membrane protein OmpA-like peptidoglycan-associated protein
MTLKQAVLATLLAGGATVAIMTGRGSSPDTDHAAASDPAGAMTAQAPATGSTPAPTTPLAAPSTDVAQDQDADDEARLAGAIAAAVAEAEAERLRLATELAAAEEEKTRLASALADAEAEAARLAEALDTALAAPPAAPGEASAVAPDAGPEIAALEALIEEQAAQIARLTAALAERDATLASLEDERKILGDLFDLAPMTATLAGPALGAAPPDAAAAVDTEADLDAALDAAKAPPPLARPGAVMTGRPVAEVHFDHGMSRLSPGGTERAREAARLIAALGVTRVRLSGHADTTGRANANMRLSQNRAEAVRAVLVAEGVRPEIIEIEAHGQEADALPVATPAGVAEPLNRRVGIYVETPVRTASLH